MTELKRIDDHIDALEERKAAVRADLLAALQSSDDHGATFEGLGSASVIRGRQSVIVETKKLVPVRFLKTEVDTTAAGVALRAGETIPGLRLGKIGAASLRIVWAK